MVESADNTIRARNAALNVFVKFLGTKLRVVPTVSSLQSQPSAWQSITPNMLDEFIQWMIEQGYALGSVNQRLRLVCGTAKMVFGDGRLTTEQKAIISMPGVSRQVGKNIATYRKSVGLPTRVGSKKEKHIRLSPEQCDMLKTIGEDTPQGRRDRLLMCLLLDHGLRPSDVIQLSVSEVDASKWSDDTCRAVQDYKDAGDCPTGPNAKVLRRSLKSGALCNDGMSVTGCNARVRDLGEHLGIDGLSPSDCKHYFDNYVATPEMTIRKLEKEKANMRDEIVALKRALRSQKAVSPRMPSVYSWSSSEIEDTD